MSNGKADPPEEVSSFTNGPKEFDMIFTKNWTTPNNERKGPSRHAEETAGISGGCTFL